MAEVVGLVAAVVQLVDVTKKTITFIESVKDASQDRLKVGREASGLLPLLYDLESEVSVNKNEEWSRCVRSLAMEHGPIGQLREALEQLAEKLKPRTGLKGTLRAFVWTLDKTHTQEILGKIERVKTRVSLALQGDTFKLLQAINADIAVIAGIDNRVSVLTSDIGKLRTDGELQQRENILDWLSPLNFFQTQQDTFARREDGTGQWFIESAVFQDWLSSTNRTLCCTGIPGAGKSILTSVVIDFLRARYTEQKFVGVAAIYCNFKERVSQTPENLLAGCSAQLVGQILPESLVKYHRVHSAQKTRLTWKEMIQIFEDIVRKLDIAYLIVDALDECSEDVRDQLLTFFQTLASNTRLMVTTRHNEEITYGFHNSLMIEIRASVGDLQRYVASRVKSNRRLSGHVRSNGPLKKHICDRVASKAEGMFLAAKLHVDALSTKTNIKQLKKALDNLSTNVNELYDDAIARIESQNHDYRTLADKALRWVAYAFRPLPVEALQEAVAIELVEPRDQQSDDEGIQDFDDEAIHSISSILDVCAGLLVHDEISGLVRLVHYTAQDYFDAHAGSKFEKGHTSIAKECVTYLSYECFQNPEESSSELEISENSDASSDDAVAGSVSASEESRCYYLFDYATAFWAQHATTKELPVEIRRFLARKPRICLLTTSKYDLYASLRGPSRNIRFLEVRHGCEIAAFYGIHDELETLCSRIKEAEVLHDLCNSSFNLAVSNGQARSIEILLDYGANINSEDKDGRTALLTASEAGNLNLMHLLLDKGFDKEARSSTGRNALLRAVEESHESCVLGLLERGADVNSKDLQGMTALHVAAYGGKIRLLNILLSRGIDQDAQDQRGETALLRAVLGSHKSCVLALLDHGADINRTDSRGTTALHVVSICDDLYLLNVLLARGSNADAKNDRGKTPLFTAVENDHEHCMLALIRHGADVNIQDNTGLSVLHIASAKGTLTSVAELANHAATISMRSRAVCSLKFLKSPELPSHTPHTFFQFEVDDRIFYHITRVATLHAPQMLKSTLQLCERAEEARVWRNGVTALDLALLREHEEVIRLLRSLTPAMGEDVSVSFDSYLLDLLEVTSIEEARRQLDARMARNARVIMLDLVARLCAGRGVTSTDEMWKEVDRKIFAEKEGFKDGLSRDTARKACLGELLSIPSNRQYWEETVGLPGAEATNMYESKEEAINEYLYMLRGLVSDEDFWKEVDRRLFAEKPAIKDGAVKEDALSQDHSKDNTLSPITSLENGNLTSTTE
ncbi:MAG: hypothetical protein Q9199_005692 [Rusavskia elegans]